MNLRPTTLIVTLADAPQDAAIYAERFGEVVNV